MKNDRISAQDWAKIEQQVRLERSKMFHEILNLPTIVLNKLKSKQNDRRHNHLSSPSNA